MDDNLFEVLQISEDAQSQEIKKAYFVLVKKYSPDNDPQKFEQIRHAYEVLKNEKSRLKYIEMRKMPPKVRESFEESTRYWEAENFDQAAKILRKLVKAEPDNDFIAENLAHVYIKKYDFVKASKIYESLYLKHPDSIVYLCYLAKTYKEKGWFKKAIPYYEKLYKLDPYCVENVIDLAECNSLSKKYDLARDLLIQVLESDKDKKNLGKNNFGNLFKVLFETDAKNKYKYFNRDYETFLSFLTEDNKNLEIFRDSMFEVLNIFLEYKHFEMIKKLLAFIENCGIKLKEEEIMHIKNVRLLVENQKIDMDNRIKKEVKSFISTYSAITIENAIPNNPDIFDDENIEIVSIIDKIMVLENVAEVEKQFDIIETDYPYCKELIQDFIDEVKATKNKSYLLKKYKDKYEKKYKRSYEICQNIFKQELNDYSAYYCDDDAFDFENEDLFDTQEPYRREEHKIGRNDPCPCGSGKKYKKCCGK